MKKLLNVIMKINDSLGMVEKMIAIVLMIGLVIACMIFITCRYVIHISVPWSDELARYLLISMGWLGAAYCTYHDDHLRIQALSGLVKAKMKNGEKFLKGVEAFTQACMCAFMIFFTWNFWGYLNNSVKSLDVHTSALHIPLWWPMYPIVLAGILMALHSFLKVFLKIGEIRGDVEERAHEVTPGEEVEQVI
ncbi:MAG: TRAP transporter small permease [Firmicutes bacterium]|nr:TRAP transporter small permease [Bacillota bacterium]